MVQGLLTLPESYIDTYEDDFDFQQSNPAFDIHNRVRAGQGRGGGVSRKRAKTAESKPGKRAVEQAVVERGRRRGRQKDGRGGATGNGARAWYCVLSTIYLIIDHLQLKLLSRHTSFTSFDD